MRTVALGIMLAFGTALTALAQAQGTNTPTPPIQGTALRQGTEVQPPLSTPKPVVVLREQPYYSGALTDIARRNALKRPPEALPRSPIQNPAIDLSTQRHRGIVLFSWNF